MNHEISQSKGAIQVLEQEIKILKNTIKNNYLHYILKLLS